MPKCFLFQSVFSLVGRLYSGGKRFAAYFILRGHDTHIDFLRLIDIVSGQDDLPFVACEQALSVWGYCEKWTHEWHARGDAKMGDGGENRRACLQALPFDARAFPLTSFEMQCSSLRLNKGF